MLLALRAQDYLTRPKQCRREDSWCKLWKRESKSLTDISKTRMMHGLFAHNRKPKTRILISGTRRWNTDTTQAARLQGLCYCC
jgi:hypothetical protein